MNTSVRLQILEVLRHHPNLTLHDLAATLCINAHHLSPYLFKLKHAGEVHITNPGRHVSGSKTLKAHYSIGAPPKPKSRVPKAPVPKHKPDAGWPFPRVSCVWDLGYYAASPLPHDQERE